MLFEAFLAVSVLLVVFIYLYKRMVDMNKRLADRINGLISSKQSLSTKYGKISEQFMPFLDQYPYRKESFRFIGSPIDGIQFEDDKIIFVEFKTSQSTMTPQQKRIKELIEKKNVEFMEFRIDKSE